MKSAAILGCGKFIEGKEGWAIGHTHAEGWRTADPNIRLIGVDVRAGNLEAFGRKFAIPASDLFPSADLLYSSLTPDFISVCTWPELHAPLVIEGAERGVKGIVCEKPMALNPGEIQDIRRACAEHGVKLVLGHQRRLEGSFQLMKKLLLAGEIGNRWVLEARVGDGWDILSWTTHWFDMANFFFDSAPLSVLAGIQHSGARRYHHAVEDQSVVFAEYPEERQAIFVTGPPAHHPAWITIRGNDGFLSLGGDGASAVEVFTRKGYVRHESPTEGLQGFSALMAELISAVETGSPMTCDAAQTALATEMAFAVHESARLRQTVKLPVDFQYALLEVIQHPILWQTSQGKVVLYADEHFGSRGPEGLVAAFQEMTGVEPFVINAAEQPLTSEHLDKAGVLALYHTQKEPDASTRSVLQAWVAARKPLLLIHAALGAYPSWEEYKRWAGRVWLWGQSEHPHEECRLTGMAAWPWREAWLPKDEVFIKLGQTAPCVDLLNADIPQGTFPAAWISQDFPTIGVWVPGHREDVWRLEPMRRGLACLLKLISKGV